MRSPLTVFVLLLAPAAVWPGALRPVITPGVNWTGVLCDRISIVSPQRGLSLQAYRRQDDGRFHSMRVNVGAGSRLDLLAPGFTRASLNSLEAAWAEDRPDGASLAGIFSTLATKEGQAVGHFFLRTAQLKQHPGWVFIRLRAAPFTEAGPLSPNTPGLLSGFYLSLHMQPQVLSQPARHMFLAWPGGVVRGGDQPPWAGQKPPSNALALFARGQGEELQSDFLLFDPQTTAVTLQRWNLGDGSSTLHLGFAPTTEFVFAIGTVTGEHGEKIVVPRFLDQEQEAMLEVLRTLDWEVTVDLAPLRKDLAEAAANLKLAPGAELQAQYDELAAAMETLQPEDPDRAAALEPAVKALAEETAVKALDALLAAQ